MNLHQAVMEYKEAEEATHKCTEMLISSRGSSPEPERLMRVMEEKKQAMYAVCQEFLKG